MNYYLTWFEHYMETHYTATSPNSCANQYSNQNPNQYPKPYPKRNLYLNLKLCDNIVFSQYSLTLYANPRNTTHDSQVM